jgi:hypothetical protein
VASAGAIPASRFYHGIARNTTAIDRRVHNKTKDMKTSKQDAREKVEEWFEENE